MPEKKEDKHADTIKVFGMILTSLPILLLRSGGAFLCFKRDAKKAGRMFQKELLRQGIDETTASQLTEIYLQPSTIKQYMGFFR